MWAVAGGWGFVHSRGGSGSCSLFSWGCTTVGLFGLCFSLLFVLFMMFWAFPLFRRMQHARRFVFVRAVAVASGRLSAPGCEGEVQTGRYTRVH